MLAHPVVAAVSDRRRRPEIDATIYVPPYRARKEETKQRAKQGEHAIQGEGRRSKVSIIFACCGSRE